ncbi:MAG: hypothetical protein JJ952_08675 [Pseudomonadales bacterium]|nr:hypothetical protein [Pseudomonadales bacterium]
MLLLVCPVVNVAVVYHHVETKTLARTGVSPEPFDNQLLATVAGDLSVLPLALTKNSYERKQRNWPFHESVTTETIESNRSPSRPAG